MATLLFDIETVGKSWGDFDYVSQQSMIKNQITVSKSAPEYNLQLADIIGKLGLSPLTGRMVTLGIYDLERSIGAVYYVGDGKGESFTVGDFTFKERTEREMLEDFWVGARDYDIFVTFNGRAFDVPFLNHRSVINEIKPTVTLANKKYLTQQSLPYHIDLQEELTFYGAMNKKPSLQSFCRAYGIEDLDTEIQGINIAELWHAKKFLEIANHSANKLIATTRLYIKWKEYLAPSSFLNAIEFNF